MPRLDPPATTTVLANQFLKKKFTELKPGNVNPDLSFKPQFTIDLLS